MLFNPAFWKGACSPKKAHGHCAFLLNLSYGSDATNPSCRHGAVTCFSPLDSYPYHVIKAVKR